MVSKQTASALTILGGVFYIFGGFIGWVAVAGFLYGFFGSSTPTTPAGPPFSGFDFGALGVALLLIITFAIFTGVMIIVGGALLNSDSSGRRKGGGGILAISMMVLGALPTLGGILIGFLLTLIGAVLGLTYKESSPDIVFGVQATSPVPNSAFPVNLGGGQKFCVRCGSPLPQGAVFCGNCGGRIS